VLAPDGTAAFPDTALLRDTSTSIVGFPLESMISLALTDLMETLIEMLIAVSFKIYFIIE
jgi:hypothetical protein